MNYKFTAVLLLLILLLCLLIRYSRETFQLDNSRTEIILTFFENLDKKQEIFYIDGKPIKSPSQQPQQPQQPQLVAAAAVTAIDPKTITIPPTNIPPVAPPVAPPVETISYTKITNKGAQEVQDCPHLLWTVGQTLESCKQLCTDDERCTTFNMIGDHCNLKSCVSCNSDTDLNCKLIDYLPPNHGSDDIEIWGSNR
jgi:hypothetical protein